MEAIVFSRVCLLTLAASCVIYAAPALAEMPLMANASEPPAGQSSIASQLATPKGAAPFAAAVDDDTLGGISGKSDLQMSIVSNNASNVSGNSVTGDSTTGEISMDGQALQNFSGLSVMTANTGNNVSINSAMNVNVSIEQH
jgi:hypothetical protein